MLLRAYTLHDVAARNFSPPFFTDNDAMAKRMVSDLVADTNTSVGRHPADYRLYWVGMFDITSGILKPLEIAEHVLDCVSLVPPTQPTMFDVPTRLKWDEFQNFMKNGGAA